jgi:hypothetical protein
MRKIEIKELYQKITTQFKIYQNSTTRCKIYHQKITTRFKIYKNFTIRFKKSDLGKAREGGDQVMGFEPIIEDDQSFALPVSYTCL